MNAITPIVAHRGFSASPNMALPQAMTSAHPHGWMTSAATVKTTPAVNANQLTSLSAMIAYLAAQSGQSEFRIERRLSDRFNVPNAKCLPSNQFDNAIRYLVEAASA